jgi:hypothetical protein
MTSFQGTARKARIHPAAMRQAVPGAV